MGDNYSYGFLFCHLGNPQVVLACLHCCMQWCLWQHPSFRYNQVVSKKTCSSGEEPVPVISHLCQWKAPRKRKESTMTMAETPFDKHVYGRERKMSKTLLEDFDLCPLQFRGTARVHLPGLLKKICGDTYAFRFSLISTIGSGMTAYHPLQSPHYQTKEHWESQSMLSKPVSQCRMKPYAELSMRPRNRGNPHCGMKWDNTE